MIISIRIREQNFVETFLRKMIKSLSFDTAIIYVLSFAKK